MLKSHEKFHSVNGKRLVLIVDDEMINREILGNILKDDYELLYAKDGKEALDLIRENKEFLSLVLLDLLMPEISGLDLLKLMKDDPSMSHIPVMVMTSERGAEVESLQLGASDFLAKPYSQPEVVMARVLKTIELSEDREIIQSTERDPLTGLYNREFFYSYADQYDQYHKDKEMDAIIVDINHFHMINERFGRDYGDAILRTIGERLREMVADTGGIVCRREADTFLVYCPHGENFQEILDYAAEGLGRDEDEHSNSRIRLRMGVYPVCDKTINIERRFDRAKLASDRIRSDYSTSIAFYDKTLHEAQIYSDRLVDDFQRAIEQKEFQVFYQPKFDVRTDEPVLASAEALVRWIHPELGFINPGVFIPLFEENGLIQQLDYYVWEESAAQLRKWKDQYDFSLSVSVNISRIDMYDPDLMNKLKGLVDKYGLSTEDLALEITESAYTEDSEQIIEQVNQLRSIGFRIEMDDFGTGYSSLNMISTLPIDVLKIDMLFIRSAFGERRDIRMLELILEIADYLSVPVIAEGVETEEQVEALKSMGCDFCQGFHFSKPVPAANFEQFLEAKKEYIENQLAFSTTEGNSNLHYLEEDKYRHISYINIAHALSSGFERIYYVDFLTNHYVKFNSKGRYGDLKVERNGADFFAEIQKAIPLDIYEEDIDKMAQMMNKETLLRLFEQEDVISLEYRIAKGGKISYHRMKIIKVEVNQINHVVIGVSNIDAQKAQEFEYEKARKVSVTYARISQALSQDYFTIYFVDLESDHFIEYSMNGSNHQLKIEREGDGFFADSQMSITELVHPDDRARASKVFDRDVLVKELEGGKTFTVTYRLAIRGTTRYVNFKALRLDEDDSHIVIGLSDVDDQIRKEKEYEAAMAATVTYSRIAQSLAQEYFSIYYVDTDTDEYIEYSSTSEYQELQVERSGLDFFKDTRQNILKTIYEPDQEKALHIWNKENVMKELENTNSYSASYRIMMDGQPVYINVKVMKMSDGDSHHIVVGISNVDAQMKREKEFVETQEQVVKDALTGVKNKLAYIQAERKLDENIAAGKESNLAVVVCDLNGLKEINDTKGHGAGDQCLIEACKIICDIFKRSPVYRIGGDEFVVLLLGQDYNNREALIREMEELNQKNAKEGKVVVACGISEYVPGSDRFLSEVFDRADGAMYANKKSLKDLV